MKRFRSTWLALMGGALLVTLSISAAFGTAPAGTREATRGQTIAALVHGVVFDTDAEPDDETESGELDEEETDAHDECVAEVAEDPDAIGGTNENHGGAVSEAARITCEETDEGYEVADPDEEDEEADSYGTCVSEVARDKSAVGGKNGNHGGAVSEAARVTCRDGADDPEETAESLDEPADASDQQAVKAEKQAAKAEQQAAKQAAKASHAAGKPSGAGNDGAEDNGKGGGNGRGGGRP